MPREYAPGSRRAARRSDIPKRLYAANRGRPSRVNPLACSRDFPVRSAPPFASNRADGNGGVNGPAKFPLFDPVFPLFEHDRPDHDLTARTADRAVLVRLRRFLAGIHAILETPDKREVGSSSLPRPIRLMGCRGSDSRCRFPPNGMGTAPSGGLRAFLSAGSCSPAGSIKARSWPSSSRRVRRASCPASPDEPVSRMMGRSAS